MSGALPTKVSPDSEETQKEITGPLKVSLKKKKVESIHRHKEHVKKAIVELEQIEEIVNKKKVSFSNSPKTSQQANKPVTVVTEEAEVLEAEQPATSTSFVKHKENLQEAIESLHVVDATLESPTQEIMASKSTTTKAKKDEEVENTLNKKQYAEEEVDYTIAAKEKLKQDEEKAYKWVEKSIDQVYWIASTLTLIASILTAFGTYMFVYLPKVLYSHHILYEMFMIHDNVIDVNHFSRNAGLHHVTLLPVIIGLMFLMVLYLAYLVQYPKQNKAVRIIRYCIFIFFELYLILGIVSYSKDATAIDTRLDAYFENDKKGMVEREGGQKQPPLFFLDQSQTYFGCCGYKSLKEWEAINATAYTGTWPLSCCDEERSGIACYGPVQETLDYTPPPKQDDKETPDPVTRQRLHEERCFDMEQKMAKTVTSLVIVFIFIYIILSIWSLVLVSRIAIIVTERNMEIKLKPQYVDFF